MIAAALNILPAVMPHMLRNASVRFRRLCRLRRGMPRRRWRRSQTGEPHDPPDERAGAIAKPPPGVATALATSGAPEAEAQSRILRYQAYTAYVDRLSELYGKAAATASNIFTLLALLVGRRCRRARSLRWRHQTRHRPTSAPDWLRQQAIGAR